MAREPIRVLVFSASMRAGSYNTRLARLAARVIAEQGAAVEEASMAEFVCPPYNQDMTERGEAEPAAVDAFRRRLVANDAFVIASPEYNASMPGHLKNAIDWVSRTHPQPFHERQGLLLSASPSMVGGNRGLWALRVPLEHLGARVYPEMFSLAQAHQAFDDSGALVDSTLAARLERTLKSYLDLVEASKHYPCAKGAWYEFLGEHPQALTARAE